MSASFPIYNASGGTLSTITPLVSRSSVIIPKAVPNSVIIPRRITLSGAPVTSPPVTTPVVTPPVVTTPVVTTPVVTTPVVTTPVVATPVVTPPVVTVNGFSGVGPTVVPTRGVVMNTPTESVAVIPVNVATVPSPRRTASPSRVQFTPPGTPNLIGSPDSTPRSLPLTSQAQLSIAPQGVLSEMAKTPKEYEVTPQEYTVIPQDYAVIPQTTSAGVLAVSQSTRVVAPPPVSAIPPGNTATLKRGRRNLLVAQSTNSVQSPNVAQSTNSVQSPIPSANVVQSPIPTVTTNVLPVAQVATTPAPVVSTPTARSVVTSTVPVPSLPPVPRLSPSRLPTRPVAEIMNHEFEIKDYQGLIANASLEQDLLNNGYAPISKVVVRDQTGDKRTQYIKAINKNGQTVFILVDVNGYTTARDSDLSVMEAGASVIPYSLKTGAYTCAEKDVCGVAFECGSNAVCMMTRGPNDLSPTESNFVFMDADKTTAALTNEGSIMTYPVVRLSEIRQNPELVLSNTDRVTRSMRNSSYSALLRELSATQDSINTLNNAFIGFTRAMDTHGPALNKSLTEAEAQNKMFATTPPTTDVDKDRLRQVRRSMTDLNDGIADLLKSMKMVALKKSDIDRLAREISEVTEYLSKDLSYAPL